MKYLRHQTISQAFTLSGTAKSTETVNLKFQKFSIAQALSHFEWRRLDLTIQNIMVT